MHALLLGFLVQGLQTPAYKGLMIDVLGVEKIGRSYTVRLWLKSGEATKPKTLRVAILEVDPRSPRKEPGRTLYEVPKRLLPDFGTLRPGVPVVRSVTFRPPKPFPRYVCPLFSVEANVKEGLVRDNANMLMMIRTKPRRKHGPRL